ncbi:MAG TPA: beta-sandwich domain-containing protein [Bdellovibrio sp.]|nr:beta-sandwich domain-containing protein [Bdellovibrio sp.]
MKKAILSSLIMLSVLHTLPASAWNDGGYPGRPPRYPGESDAPRMQLGAVQIANISSQPGGQLLRVNLYFPLRLKSLQVVSLDGGLLIHEASLITQSGSAIPVRQFTATSLMNPEDIAYSESFDSKELIVAIDIRVESLSGLSVIEFRALSEEAAPILSVISN